jgi:hypothetical protein
VSPFRPFLPPQCVYPKGPRRLPSLPTTHDRIVFSYPLSTIHYPLPTLLRFSLSTTPYPLPTLLRPLFSYSYELPLRQVLYFDNHPHCPGVWGSMRSISPLATRHSPLPLYKPLFPPARRTLWLATPFVSHPYKTPGVWGLFPFGFSRITGHESQVTPFHQLAASLASPKKSTPLQSSKSSLFSGNTGVGWVSRTQLRDTRGEGVPLRTYPNGRGTLQPSPLATRRSPLLPWTP